MIYAQATNYIVRAGNTGTPAFGSSTMSNTLVDEAGDTLVDEDGNILVSEEITTVYGVKLYAQATDYTVHIEV